VLAVVEKLVLVWCWHRDIFCVNMGGVRRGMEDAAGETVGVRFHHALGFRELGTERWVRERGAWVKAEEGKFSDGHRGWLCGLVAALKVRSTVVEDPDTYRRTTSERICRLSS
jgi:hypothetical protein